MNQEGEHVDCWEFFFPTEAKSEHENLQVKVIGNLVEINLHHEVRQIFLLISFEIRSSQSARFSCLFHNSFRCGLLESVAEGE